MLAVGVEGENQPRVPPEGVRETGSESAAKTAVDEMGQHVDTVGARYLFSLVPGAVVDNDYLIPFKVAEQVFENAPYGSLLVVGWDNDVGVKKVLY